MNWEAISAIGEIVGATAVVVTLIYLAVQVRQGTRATQAVSIQTASSLDQEFLLAIGADAATSEMWATYMSKPETLPHDQQLRGSYLIASVVRRLENIYLQKRLGAISEEGWRSRQQMFVGIARSAGYAAFLNSPPAAFFGQDFGDYMAQLRREDGDAE